MNRFFILLPVLLSACADAPSTIYAGPVTPTAGMCDPRSRATLTLKQSAFVFAPNSGTLILAGHLTAGQLAASLTLPGADKKPYPVSFTATLAGTTIAGTYITPRCRYAVSLTATQD